MLRQMMFWTKQVNTQHHRSLMDLGFKPATSGTIVRYVNPKTTEAKDTLRYYAV